MAFVHCHSCSWQQDDFWSRSYNPIRWLVKNILMDWSLYRPHVIKGDKPFWPRHSWYYILWEIWRHIRPSRYWNQKWWTYGAWKRAVKRNGGKWPSCPKCGSGLCID